MIFRFLENTRKFSSKKFPNMLPVMIWMGRIKFPILVAIASLIWYSLVLFQHQTQQWKQNVRNLMSILQSHVFDHIWKKLFWPLSAKQNSGENSKMQVIINWNSGFHIYRENVILLYVFDVYEISINFPRTIFISE